MKYHWIYQIIHLDPKISSVEAIVQAISELPDKYRDVLKLSYLYDHTTEEIGIALNLSTNTVHKRISRAKKLLKVILTKEGVLQ